MSPLDAFRKRRARPAAGADPAAAFGAEEQTMEEIRRQNFVPPEKKGPGVAARAGAMLSSLRQKIAGGDDPDFDGFGGDPAPRPAPREAAPVYSSQTYDQPAAPDMGWENPFAPPSPGSGKTAARPADRYTEPEPAEPYPQPVYTEPAFDDFYGQGGYDAPAYGQEPWSPEPAPAAWDPYAPYGYDPYAGAYPGDPYAGDGYAQPQPYGWEYQPGAGGWYGPDSMPRRTPPRKKRNPGDFKYYFWACSIAAGMVLTLFSFIYGCVV